MSTRLSEDEFEVIHLLAWHQGMGNNAKKEWMQRIMNKDLDGHGLARLKDILRKSATIKSVQLFNGIADNLRHGKRKN